MRQRGLELVDDGLVGVKRGEQSLGILVPKDAAVLLAGAADTADSIHGHRHGLLQAVEDEVEGLHPQGDGGVYLACFFADMDALFDAVGSGKVAIKVDLGLAYRLEIGADDNG